MFFTVFALCCIFASITSPTFAQYGYGPSPPSGRGGYDSSRNDPSDSFAGYGPISTAIRSSHYLDIIDMPKSDDNIKSSTVEVGASSLPLNIGMYLIVQ